MSPRAKAVSLGVGALVALQAAALAVYWRVERSRKADRAPALRYERLAAGRLAPDLELRRVDGSTVRLSDLRGKTVLLHFWATWCPPCREELPGLLKLGRELARGDGFELIAVTVDTEWDTVRAFFGGEIPPVVLQDASGTGYRRYEISTLPDTYVVAPDGSLAVRFGGAREWQSEGARELLLREVEAGH